MIFLFKAVLLVLAAATAFPLSAKERKYTDNDIKRILYLKNPASNAPAQFAVLEGIHKNRLLECRYFGTQQPLNVDRQHVIPTIFYEDSSNFMITQYALIAMFQRQKPTLALALAKLNNDTTGRMSALNNYAASLKDLQKNISVIRHQIPPNSPEQANALADLISRDKTLSLIRQAATYNDWVLAIALFDNYREEILTTYNRYFSHFPDVIKVAQVNCAACENELVLNFANKFQTPNARRKLFLHLYPQARGMWTQPPPTNYEQLKAFFVRSLNSYHKLDKISRIFKPQDWGSAMLEALMTMDGAACAAELEKEFDDEMRRLARRSQRP